MPAHTDTIRCFIACYPDPDALNGIIPFLECMRQKNPSIRWEKGSQVHITIKFLGDILRDTAFSIEQHLKERLNSQEPFGAVIDTVGGFPNLRKPRIVWLGFSTPIPPMIEIQAAVEDSCLSMGIEKEAKPFVPHFTIGRVKDYSKPGDLEKDIQSCSFTPVRVFFTAVRIMESTLTPQGAIHKELARIDF